MKRGNIYSISYKNITRITQLFFLESTNLFIIYSYKTSFNFLFRFSLLICFCYFLYFFTFFTSGLYLFYLLWDQIWHLSGPVSKNWFNFAEFFWIFLLKTCPVRLIPLNHGHGSMESIAKYSTPRFTSKDLSLKVKDHLSVKLYQF